MPNNGETQREQNPNASSGWDVLQQAPVEGESGHEEVEKGEWVVAYEGEDDYGKECTCYTYKFLDKETGGYQEDRRDGINLYVDTEGNPYAVSSSSSPCEAAMAALQERLGDNFGGCEEIQQKIAGERRLNGLCAAIDEGNPTFSEDDKKFFRSGSWIDLCDNNLGLNFPQYDERYEKIYDYMVENGLGDEYEVEDDESESAE